MEWRRQGVMKVQVHIIFFYFSNQAVLTYSSLGEKPDCCGTKVYFEHEVLNWDQAIREDRC